jgi:hypothetical protein
VVLFEDEASLSNTATVSYGWPDRKNILSHCSQINYAFFSKTFMAHLWHSAQKKVRSAHFHNQAFWRVKIKHCFCTSKSHINGGAPTGKE